MQQSIPDFEIVWRAERSKHYLQWWESGRLRRVSTGTDDKNAAKRFLADFINGWITPTEEEKAELTINQVVDLYTEHKKRKHRERYKNDGSLEERFIIRNIKNLDNGVIYPLAPIKEHWGELHPRQITRSLCREFSAMRIEEDGMSPSTTKKSLDMVVAAMNHARKEGLLDIVPHVEKPEESPPKEEWARPHQIKQLMLALKRYPHLELFALLALHTLSRKRAICELKWDQVDFDLKQIDFNPPGRKRTRKRRVPVPINNTLMEALVAAREVATTDHVIEFRGNPCYEVGRAFRKYARLANLGWITPHILRHTGATLMAQNRVSMVEIAGIMGDKIETVEKHYLKYHPDYLKDASSALDKIYA